MSSPLPSAASPTARAILDLLRELQALDRLPRVGYSLRGVPEPESISEHLFHVAFLVWALGRREADLDLLRALELALLHDLAEVRFGDLPRTAAHYLPPGAKRSAERRAAADLLAPLGEDAAARVVEYQEAASREARFVAVCDKLQLVLKAGVYESWGARALSEFRDGLVRFDDGGFGSVAEVVAALRHSALAD